MYTAGTFEAALDGGDSTVEGRILDSGTAAIYRAGYGQFMILQDTGDGRYVPVGSALSKADALAKANRIPMFTSLTNPGPDADPMDKQVAESNMAVISAVAKTATDGPITTDQARQKLTDRLDQAADSLGGAPVRNEIHDAAGRHKKRIRERTADEASATARAAALAAGATAEEAEAAYRTAHRAKLGTHHRRRRDHPVRPQDPAGLPRGDTWAHSASVTSRSRFSERQ
ncbi:hypothetical protein [Rhodococcus sp. ACT016]|uniref:hypothetical protein n=1 Tax=Rhodococcus sp. ACT016 TaxID=3134808 RepID=UPI003D280121